MDRLLNVVSALSVALFVMVLVSTRRAHIRVEYSVSWLAAAAVLFVLSRAKGTLHWLSEAMGITYPPLALILLGACVFLLVFYRFSIRISDLKDANIALTQRVAILEYRLQSRDEKDEDQARA
ncbi:MAG TPA: DUF2304 domain-containing protein [Bryobacteraceae bacterium]|nr:DUF2304 domain-containing protein [Bryobacteraceae bacterium]